MKQGWTDSPCFSLEPFLQKKSHCPQCCFCLQTWECSERFSCQWCFQCCVLVAKSWAESLLHFIPVADERRRRPQIQACQRMPSSLSREKEEMQAGSIFCWWKQKTFVTPLLLVPCAFCLLCTHPPGDSSRGTEGSWCCHRPAVIAAGCVTCRVLGCAFPLPCTWRVTQPRAALVLGGRWFHPNTDFLKTA